ncbi:hypothetical protein EDC96DRAFT_507829 [Choanephora cucurbitarum]|nr:hypothetical protein EDC96DRAFT_507829 [Choanephora cucurbitarum]
MGCCGSKEDHEEDDVNAPLLDDRDRNVGYTNFPGSEPIDVKKEQEVWNSIIDRATQNLIDISSVQTDPLQETDIEERKKKYHHLLSQIQTPAQPFSTPPTRDTNTILDILTNAKPNGGMTDGEVDWLYQTMDEIQDALHHVEIEPVGDMVVHLTMSDHNAAIRAY